MSNHTNKLVLAALLAMPALMSGTFANAQSAASDAVAPDNTKSNKMTPSNRVATADKQKNDATDLDLAKRIRQSVVSDSSLSTYAHNVKIVAVDGTVTLNGVVSTADEKMQISKKALSIAGAGHVVDDLKVAPSK
jgi:hyperosmotically inducible protein